MPLDNKKLTPEIMDYLYGIPLDEDVWQCVTNLPHQTKVEIYDKRCKGCGFMRVEVGERIFRSVEEAIDVAMTTGLPIKRTCDYPSDIDFAFGEVIYPSLTTIVINTCRFWDTRNIEGDDDDKERLPKQ